MPIKSTKASHPAPATAKKKLGHHNLHQVFDAAKKTVAVHSKLCIQLLKIYHKVEFNEFFSEFVDLLKLCLVVGEKHPQVERCLSFVASFATCDKRIKDDKTAKKLKDDENLDEFPEETDQGKEILDAQGVMEEMEENEDVDEFLIKIFQFLLNIHEARSAAVRYRVCQLINRVLNSMSKSASLDDDLFNTIYDTMLERLMDKKPAVRVQAIHALYRLQDPSNKDCPVIKAYRYHLSIAAYHYHLSIAAYRYHLSIAAYRYHLSMDPASEVRRAALCCTGINFHTLPDVLQRTRDKNNLVRRQAYVVLAQKVHIRSLQISQRVRLLSEGLNDRSDLVRVAVQKTLLNSWLRFVNGSILDLLTCLDVEASTKVAELALDSLFQDVPAATLVQAFDMLDGNKLVQLDKLKPESALYWKTLAKHLKKEGADEELDFILPDLTVFCTYTETFALHSEPVEDKPLESDEDKHAAALRHLERQFVLQQLVSITAYYDLADEVGRRSLVEMVRRLLVCRDLTEASIAALVEAFGRLCRPASRVQQLAEIISDVREVPNDSVEAAAVADTSPRRRQASSQPPTPAPISEDEARAVKIKAAKVRVELNEVREALEDCVRSLDLDHAQELKLRLTVLQEQHELLQQELTTPLPALQPNKQAEPDGDESRRCADDEGEEQQQQQEMPALQEEDAPTLSHCLTIVCEMLRSPDINTLSPTLHSLHDNLLLPCLKNQWRCIVFPHEHGGAGWMQYVMLDIAGLLQDAVVREMSVRALSLFCIISKDLAHKHLPLLIQISQVDTEVVQVAAVQAVFDVLLLHGMLHLTDQPHQLSHASNDADSLISLLSKRLENDEGEVRSAVVLGLCKLLDASRLHCPKLLSQLVLLWYNPLTEKDTRLRQMLGSFFPVYASRGGLHQETLSASLLMTVRVLLDASPQSSHGDVDIDDVCSFFLSITSPAIVAKDAQSQGEVTNVHDSLVFTLCGEILAYPNSSLALHLSRALRLLSLTPNNFINLSQVHSLVSKLLKRVRGNRSLTMPLEKLMATVMELLKRAPAPMQDSAEPNLTTESSLWLSGADEFSTIMDKTAEGTFARRKKLYSNDNPSELLSSEAESEVGGMESGKVKPRISSDSAPTCLNASGKDENSSSVSRYEDDNPAACDQEVQISGERDTTDIPEEQLLSSTVRSSVTITVDSAAGGHSTAEAADDSAADDATLVSGTDKIEDTSTRSSIPAPIKKHRMTRTMTPATSDHRSSLAASRRSRRAAVRTSGADASTDEEAPQPLSSGTRRGVAGLPSASTQRTTDCRSSRGKSLHCVESNSSSNSASPPRPATKRRRGSTVTMSPSSANTPSPTSSIISTRSTRSSTAASDCSSRRSVRS
ncbi:Nuclear condensin complex subunit 3 C-terminal domain [Trinorchestia longiramus]|nr:Nuclear condensin complex subunit 3 C-terminal domain [Trinorchestia longiramus]